MTEAPPALNDQKFLSALLNIVIPPSAAGDLPGAGTLGLEPAVASALKADLVLGPPVAAGAEAVREAALSQHPEGLTGLSREDGTRVVEAQLVAHPFFLPGLLRYLYAAYYQHPRVLEGIGEPPRPPFPEGFDVQATDTRLLAKLQARRRSRTER